MSVEVEQLQSDAEPNRSLDRRSSVSRLLEVRVAKKAHTPKFQRQESWRYVRIHEPWRKPKGVDSHMRLSIKGWPRLVKIGYRGPKLVRGLHPSGYRDVLVHNLAEIELLSPLSDAARLAAGVGRKKRIEIAKKAKELGIRVLNGGGLLGGQDVSQEGREPSRDHEENEEPSAPSVEVVPTTAAEDSPGDTKESSPSAAGSRTRQEKKRPKKGQKKKSGKKSASASKKKKTSKAESKKKNKKKGKK